MNLREYIEFYENEVKKLETKRYGNLEIDKSTYYYDKKIEHVEGLINILNNCVKSEKLKEENREYQHMLFAIGYHLQKIEKSKKENDSKKTNEEILTLLACLKQAIENKED